MTAVAVQQNGDDRQQYNPRRSAQSSKQTSSTVSRASSHAAPTTQYTQNGSPSRVEAMNGDQLTRNTRTAASNGTMRAANGTNMRSVSATVAPARDLSSNPSFSSALDDEQNPAMISRPATTTNTNHVFAEGRESSQDDSEIEKKVKRRPKPLLQRAKTDYGPRGDDTSMDGEVTREAQDWGSRHGFDDHYASEEYVSLLANVGCSFS